MKSVPVVKDSILMFIAPAKMEVVVVGRAFENSKFSSVELLM